MEDVLELAVEDNEFENEPTKDCQNVDGLGGKSSEPKMMSSHVFNPKDYLTLYEAKKKLLESLAELEEKSDTKLSARPSVKSRLGVRKTVEDVEFMDCTETELDYCVDLPHERGRKIDGSKAMVDREYGKNKNTKAREDIPHETSMKTLCQRLRVKWHDSPEKIGKEIAERLQENKHCLIINIVKIIGGKKAIELFSETKRIQLEGGMKIRNGSRRRTSGGVFLNLLKSKNYATAEEIKTIFKQDTKIKNEIMKRKRALQRQQQHEKIKKQKMMVDDDTMVESQNNTTEQELPK